MAVKWRWVLVGCVGSWLGYQWLSQRAIKPRLRSTRRPVQATSTPTLFIPGWGGNAWTYNGMLRWFAAQGYAAKRLTIRVDRRGRLHFQGKWVPRADNPTIQVLFERNFTADYRQQIQWLTQILRVLRTRFGVTTYNAVAHSWGGSALVQSLVTNGADPGLPRLHRLILLGTPVDERSEQSAPDPLYQRLLTLRQNLWANAGAEIHNVYGLLAGRATDGQVPVRQVIALRAVVAGSPIRYSEHPVVSLGHGRLHSAFSMWPFIAQLLWVKKDG